MKMYDIIQKKKKGQALSDHEIEFFIKGYTDGSIPDYQASALLMAICFMGMTDEETVTLTNAMADSGDRVDLSCFGNLSADKHSTGGVGDKTSLIVAPIVASLGGKVTKMSGRGLGHTGGTVDKLESIPGYRVNLTPEEFLSQVEKVGMAVVGQSGNLTPADKKLYALRDVTATVDNIPLITSSIMSKKLAAGSHNIVLDVKVGSGAFMKTPDEATELAQKMVKIGKDCNRNMAALITNMGIPLGNNVGNSLEVIEAIRVLKGELKNDLYEVCVALATTMVELIFSLQRNEAEQKVKTAIESGNAFRKMKEWIKAQGGNADYIENTDLFEQSKYSLTVKSVKEGYISSMNVEKIGMTAVTLGAGRRVATDTIDYSAGIIIHKKTGEYVKENQDLCTLYSNNESSLKEAEKQYLEAVIINSERPETNPLIYDIIQ